MVGGREAGAAAYARLAHVPGGFLCDFRPCAKHLEHRVYEEGGKGQSFLVAPSDIISNLSLEDLEKIWELKKWIPDPWKKGCYFTWGSNSNNMEYPII